MRLCVICRNRPAGSAAALACARCAGVLAADGHTLAPAASASGELTADILAGMRDRVARIVGGVPFERELTSAEVDALLRSFPDE